MKQNPSNRSTQISRFVAFCCACVLSSSVFAAGQAAANANLLPTQSHEVLTQKVREFLVSQSAGLQGQVNVSVVPVDPKLKLAACDSIEAFFPGSGKAWGRASVGLRCHDDAARWTVYIQGNVSVFGNYLVAATNLGQGQMIQPRDVMFQRGDLTILPPNIFTSDAQVVGRVTRIAMNVGMVLKQEMAALPVIVQYGQSVRIMSSGDGFTISAEGKAQNNATQGQLVQVRVASGQMVSGIANANGAIEVQLR